MSKLKKQLTTVVLSVIMLVALVGVALVNATTAKANDPTVNDHIDAVVTAVEDAVYADKDGNLTEDEIAKYVATLDPEDVEAVLYAEDPENANKDKHLDNEEIAAYGATLDAEAVEAVLYAGKDGALTKEELDLYEDMTANIAVNHILEIFKSTEDPDAEYAANYAVIDDYFTEATDLLLYVRNTLMPYAVQGKTVYYSMARTQEGKGVYDYRDWYENGKYDEVLDVYVPFTAVQKKYIDLGTTNVKNLYTVVENLQAIEGKMAAANEAVAAIVGYKAGEGEDYLDNTYPVAAGENDAEKLANSKTSIENAYAAIKAIYGADVVDGKVNGKEDITEYFLGPVKDGGEDVDLWAYYKTAQDWLDEFTADADAEIEYIAQIKALYDAGARMSLTTNDDKTGNIKTAYSNYDNLDPALQNLVDTEWYDKDKEITYFDLIDNAHNGDDWDGEGYAYTNAKSMWYGIYEEYKEICKVEGKIDDALATIDTNKYFNDNSDAAIKAARKAFDALMDDSKGTYVEADETFYYVENYPDLLKAEENYAAVVAKYDAAIDALVAIATADSFKDAYATFKPLYNALVDDTNEWNNYYTKMQVELDEEDWITYENKDYKNYADFALVVAALDTEYLATSKALADTINKLPELKLSNEFKDALEAAEADYKTVVGYDATEVYDEDGNKNDELVLPAVADYVDGTKLAAKRRTFDADVAAADAWVETVEALPAKVVLDAETLEYLEGVAQVYFDDIEEYYSKDDSIEKYKTAYDATVKYYQDTITAANSVKEAMKDAITADHDTLVAQLALAEKVQDARAKFTEYAYEDEAVDAFYAFTVEVVEPAVEVPSQEVTYANYALVEKAYTDAKETVAKLALEAIALAAKSNGGKVITADLVKDLVEGLVPAADPEPEQEPEQNLESGLTAEERAAKVAALTDAIMALVNDEEIDAETYEEYFNDLYLSDLLADVIKGLVEADDFAEVPDGAITDDSLYVIDVDAVKALENNDAYGSLPADVQTLIAAMHNKSDATVGYVGNKIADNSAENDPVKLKAVKAVYDELHTSQQSEIIENPAYKYTDFNVNYTQIVVLGEQLQQAMADIEELKEAVADLQATYATEEDLDALAARVQELEDTYATAEGLQEVAAELAALKAVVGTPATETDEATGLYALMATKAELAAVQEELDRVKATIGNPATENDAATGLYKDIADADAALQQAINALTAEKATKEELQAAVNTLNNTLATLRADLDADVAARQAAEQKLDAEKTAREADKTANDKALADAKAANDKALADAKAAYEKADKENEEKIAGLQSYCTVLLVALIVTFVVAAAGLVLVFLKKKA